jgi:O-antigen ligase
MDLAKVAVNAYTYRPIIGIGAGSNFSWQKLYADNIPSRLVDNLYLTILSEVGTVGFILFLIILFLWMRYLFLCLIDTGQDDFVRNVAIVILALSMGYLGVALIGQEFESFEAWIMLGIASAIRNIQIMKRKNAPGISCNR